MGYLHNFTVTVLLVAVLCFICEVLTVEGVLGKYTSLVTGLVISLAIVSAFLQIRDVEFSVPDFQTERYATAEDVQADAVASQFALDLKTAVETAIFEKFGVPVAASAHVSCADGVITVEHLTVKNEKMDAGTLQKFIETQFGITPVIT